MDVRLFTGALSGWTRFGSLLLPKEGIFFIMYLFAVALHPSCDSNIVKIIWGKKHTWVFTNIWVYHVCTICIYILSLILLVKQV